METPESIVNDFSVYPYPAVVRTFRVKAFFSAAAVVQSRTVQQREDGRVNDIPQLVTQGRAKVADEKHVAFFYGTRICTWTL